MQGWVSLTAIPLPTPEQSERPGLWLGSEVGIVGAFETKDGSEVDLANCTFMLREPSPDFSNPEARRVL